MCKPKTMKRKSETAAMSPVNKKRKVVRKTPSKASPFDLSNSGRAKYIDFLRRRLLSQRRNADEE